jgi:small subunit ribosomal protein S17
MSETTSNKRTLVGRVVSDRMDKTVTVIVERRVKHAMYNKIIVRSSKYHAHNDNNEAKIGDGRNPGVSSAVEDQVLGRQQAA